LGDFEFRTPQNWGAGGPSATMKGLNRTVLGVSLTPTWL
jgi:hypothetical protein